MLRFLARITGVLATGKAELDLLFSVV